MKDPKQFNKRRGQVMAGIFSAAFLALAFALCGCLHRPRLNTQTFSFSASMSSATNAAANNLVLGLRSLQVNPPFDGRSLIYRTGEYLFERDPYAEFLDSPDKDLVAPVCGLLRATGRFRSVVGPDNTVKPDMLVEITVDELYGDIRKTKSPCAVLAIQVIFLEATNGFPGKVILQRNYSRSVPMKSTSPAALMEGWNRALGEIFAEAMSDLNHQEIEH